MSDEDIEGQFWKVFSRTLGVNAGPECVRVIDLEEWDSLKHVELMFEMEEKFDLSLSPDDIAALYSDTDKVIAFLRANV